MKPRMEAARMDFRHHGVPGGLLVVSVTYFAVATYPEHEPRVHLFGVSAMHEVVCDFDHDSAEEAMQVARASGFTHDDFRPYVA